MPYLILSKRHADRFVSSHFACGNQEGLEGSDGGTIQEGGQSPRAIAVEGNPDKTRDCKALEFALQY